MTFNNYKQYKQLTKKGQFSDVHLSDLDAGQATNEYMHTIHQLIDLGESALFVSPVSLWKPSTGHETQTFEELCLLG